MPALLSPPQFRTWTYGDGYVARGRYWPATRSETQSAFLYLHGIQSHGGWYEWSASLLAASGAAVVMPDRRGSGMNEAARGDAPSGERWFADLDDTIAAIESEIGPRRWCVVGVSWGGKLATAWALRRPRRVERLMLVAPGLFARLDVGFARRIGVGLSLLSDGGRHFVLPLNNPQLFTDNARWQQFIAADPLKLTQATARFLYYSSRLDTELARARPHVLQAPATLFLAGRDRIIRNESTLNWLQKVAATHPTVVHFNEAAHTIEFEADSQPFAAALTQWAAECVGGAGRP